MAADAAPNIAQCPPPTTKVSTQSVALVLILSAAACINSWIHPSSAAPVIYQRYLPDEPDTQGPVILPSSHVGHVPAYYRLKEPWYNWLQLNGTSVTLQSPSDDDAVGIYDKGNEILLALGIISRQNEGTSLQNLNAAHEYVTGVPLAVELPSTAQSVIHKEPLVPLAVALPSTSRSESVTLKELSESFTTVDTPQIVHPVLAVEQPYTSGEVAEHAVTLRRPYAQVVKLQERYAAEPVGSQIVSSNRQRINDVLQIRRTGTVKPLLVLQGHEVPDEEQIFQVSPLESNSAPILTEQVKIVSQPSTIIRHEYTVRPVVQTKKTEVYTLATRALSRLIKGYRRKALLYSRPIQEVVASQAYDDALYLPSIKETQVTQDRNVTKQVENGQNETYITITQLEQESVPTTEEIITIPFTEKIITVPTTEEIITVPSTESTTEEIIAEKIILVPTSEEKITAPTTEKVVTAPVTEEVVTDSTTERGITISTTEEVVTEKVTIVPTTNDTIIAAPTTEKFVTSVTEETVTVPTTEKTEEIITEKVIVLTTEETITVPATEKTEEIFTEKIIIVPTNEETITAPTTVKDITAPATEEIIVAPTTQKVISIPTTDGTIPEKIISVPPSKEIFSIPAAKKIVTEKYIEEASLEPTRQPTTSQEPITTTETHIEEGVTLFTEKQSELPESTSLIVEQHVPQKIIEEITISQVNRTEEQSIKHSSTAATTETIAEEILTTATSTPITMTVSDEPALTTAKPVIPTSAPVDVTEPVLTTYTTEVVDEYIVTTSPSLETTQADPVITTTEIYITTSPREDILTTTVKPTILDAIETTQALETTTMRPAELYEVGKENASENIRQEQNEEIESYKVIPAKEVALEYASSVPVGKVVVVETIQRIVEAKEITGLDLGHPRKTVETIVEPDGTIRKIESYVVYDSVPVRHTVLTKVPDFSNATIYTKSKVGPLKSEESQVSYSEYKKTPVQKVTRPSFDKLTLNQLGSTEDDVSIGGDLLTHSKNHQVSEPQFIVKQVPREDTNTITDKRGGASQQLSQILPSRNSLLDGDGGVLIGKLTGNYQLTQTAGKTEEPESTTLAMTASAQSESDDGFSFEREQTPVGGNSKVASIASYIEQYRNYTEETEAESLGKQSPSGLATEVVGEVEDENVTNLATLGGFKIQSSVPASSTLSSVLQRHESAAEFSTLSEDTGAFSIGGVQLSEYL